MRVAYTMLNPFAVNPRFIVEDTMDETGRHEEVKFSVDNLTETLIALDKEHKVDKVVIKGVKNYTQHLVEPYMTKYDDSNMEIEFI